MLQDMKKIIFAIVCSVLFPALSAFASNPILSINPSGNGNDVNISIINADPNVPVILYYNTTTSQANQLQNIGTTDTNGSFNGSVSTSAYKIA